MTQTPPHAPNANAHGWSSMVEARTAVALVLAAIGADASHSEIAQALPHSTARLSLTGLRNALCELGLHTTQRGGRIADLDPRLRIVAFQAKGDDNVLLVDLSGNDGPKLITPQGPRPTPNDLATLFGDYVVVQVKHSSASSRPAIEKRWFWNTLQRFGQHIKVLMAISLSVNVLAVALPLMIMVIYDRIIGQNSGMALPMFAMALVAIVIADFALNIVKLRILSRMAARLDQVIGVNVLKKLFRLPMANVDQTPAKNQIQRIKDFEGIRDFFSNAIAVAVVELPFFALVLIVLAMIAGPLVIIPIVAGLGLIAINVLASQRIRNVESNAYAARTALYAKVLESSTLSQTITRAGVQDVWRQRFRTLSARAAHGAAQQKAATATVEAVSNFFLNAAALATLVLGAVMVMAGSMTMGALIAAMALVWRSLAPLQTIALAAGRLAQISRAIRQLNSFFALPETPRSQTQRQPLQIPRGPIEFDRVALRYPGTRDPALLGVSFHVDDRQMLAITGPAGSGKTTIAKLLLRLYEPQSGFIRIAATDLRQYAAHDLRRQVGFAPQTTDLFYGTIEQNITLGHALHNPVELQDAIERTGLAAAMQAAGYQLDDRVGDQFSKRLPSSLARCISLARALVRDPGILILDEPERDMDQRTVHRFHELIAAERERRTIVLISHRPSFINLADTAILLKDGAVACAGAPNDIVARLLPNANRAA